MRPAAVADLQVPQLLRVADLPKKLEGRAHVSMTDLWQTQDALVAPIQLALLT
jgi:hypothetical protein